MFEKALQIVAPHHCYGCQLEGSILCANCKYNIIHENFSRCIGCLRLAAYDGVCNACRLPYSRAWVVSGYDETVKRTLHGYKFERKKAAAYALAELMDATLPVLPDDLIVCSVPTIASHVRQRGYDHAFLFAKLLARRRNLKIHRSLARISDAVQVGAKRSERISNAKHSFLPRKVRKNARYLLVDDVMTTGATLEYASKALLKGGAKEVWVAVVARQTLDKQYRSLV